MCSALDLTSNILKLILIYFALVFRAEELAPEVRLLLVRN